MHPKDIRIADYEYDLPPHKIALQPLAKRSDARLLVYKNGEISDSKFTELPDLLPANACLILNETKVVKARLHFKNLKGQAIELFCLSPGTQYADMTIALAQNATVLWECLVGGAKRWPTNEKLSITLPQGGILYAEQVARKEKHFEIRFSWLPDAECWATILEVAGNIPLPPYLNRQPTDEDTERYQTIWAQNEGSVAAPTASLHIDAELLEELNAGNVEVLYTTLHVGAGTFVPVKSSQMAGHDMHGEWMVLDVLMLTQLKEMLEEGRPIIPVGTTAMRTLESIYWIGHQLLDGNLPDWSRSAVSQWYAYEILEAPAASKCISAILKYLNVQKKSHLHCQTKIMIAPGYQFRISSGLVTNFHQPGSTLLLLVAALVGLKYKDLYAHALQHDYRFLSYGDGSLLLPNL